jgi:rod shape determining protein RodA
LINNQGKLIKKIDFTFLISVLLLAVYGLVILFGSGVKGDLAYFKSQIIWFTLGLSLLVFFAFVSYKQYKHYIIIAYVIDIVLLLIVLIIGKSTMGAQRWISIGFFKLQPSEFTKVIVIVAISAYLSEKKGILTLKDIGISFAIVGAPLLLIFVQPDLGTALVLLVIWLCLIMVAGIKLKHLSLIFLTGLLVIFGAFQLKILKQYQVNRLLVFINPNLDTLGAGYNLTQSKIAVGSGGITGKGLANKSSQTSLNFIPEAHTDFIFAVIGEELGLIGAIFLLALYLFVLSRAIRTSIIADDYFGSLVVLAIVSMWLFQIFINIGMTIGIMPVTGIPLPFISYGGSSLFTNMSSAGVILSVYSHSIK